MARMTSEGLVDGSLFALWEIREALEEEIGSKAAANCYISVASEWVITSGKQLYNEVLKAEPQDERQARIMQGGSLYNGEPGFCQKRWQFWKLRFSQLKDEVDKDVAEIAQQAICVMEVIEKRKRKRDLDLSD
jgi:hypothetical protein